ncbi:MAG: hypothetical protein KAQ92_07440 [Candidatus Aenigmarchaeota archaeon]|nr:hypothetical protein [Candidatus Aenigmarchaeota archaeon]
MDDEEIRKRINAIDKEVEGQIEKLSVLENKPVNEVEKDFKKYESGIKEIVGRDENKQNININNKSPINSKEQNGFKRENNKGIINDIFDASKIEEKQRIETINKNHGLNEPKQTELITGKKGKIWFNNIFEQYYNNVILEPKINITKIETSGSYRTHIEHNRLYLSQHLIKNLEIIKKKNNEIYSNCLNSIIKHETEHICGITANKIKELIENETNENIREIINKLNFVEVIKKKYAEAKHILSDEEIKSMGFEGMKKELVRYVWENQANYQVVKTCSKEESYNYMVYQRIISLIQFVLNFEEQGCENYYEYNFNFLDKKTKKEVMIKEQKTIEKLKILFHQKEAKTEIIDTEEKYAFHKKRLDWLKKHCPEEFNEEGKIKENSKIKPLENDETAIKGIYDRIKQRKEELIVHLQNKEFGEAKELYEKFPNSKFKEEVGKILEKQNLKSELSALIKESETTIEKTELDIKKYLKKK